MQIIINNNVLLIVKKENVSFDYKNTKGTQFSKHYSLRLWTKYFIVSPVIQYVYIAFNCILSQ